MTAWHIAVSILLYFFVVYEAEDLKTKKYLKNTLRCGLIRKNTNFRGFRVFDFALYPKSKIYLFIYSLFIVDKQT